MKSVTVLGSTGSIGTQSLEVIDALGLKVAALAANKSVELLEKQIRQYNPGIAAVYDEAAADILRARVSDTRTAIVSGMKGLIAVAELDDADTVITSVSGMIGLEPTIAAIKKGKRIALANKETLVCAGELVMRSAAEYGAEIIPVDSEHSAIFQCLSGKNASSADVKSIILTASGGPFRGYDSERLKGVTKAQALKHPNWKMGSKITIDSATLMNKGLEFIEAMHLFDASPDKIRILVHPQSIIHSMVEFSDNSVIAQLGRPDMKLPIRYALTYPERSINTDSALDFLAIRPLTFEEPDMTVFKCLKIAIDAAKTGGTACALMNAANETAVSMFLNDRISFCEIYDKVAYVMDNAEITALCSIEDVFAAKETAERLLRDT